MENDGTYVEKDGYEAENAQNKAENSVLNTEKVDEAIGKVINVFSELNLTVAECIQTILSVNFALREQYPHVYKLMRVVKQDDLSPTEKIMQFHDEIDAIMDDSAE